MASRSGGGLTADAGILTRKAAQAIRGRTATLLVIDDHLTLAPPDKKAVQIVLRHNKTSAMYIEELEQKLRTLHSMDMLNGVLVSFDGQVSAGYNGTDLESLINRVKGLYARAK